MGKRKNNWEKRRKQFILDRARRSRSQHGKDSGRNSTNYIAWCQEHGKKLLSRPEARELIRRLNTTGMREYRCRAQLAHEWWHVGHLPENVRRGYLPAHEVYERE